ncbi:MAG: NAD-dependent epimerase/dehydratase family protein [Candidatus Accumulibacter sp.]|jgi:nucleoside-diphosphate-sugar epimerase|nr:NAD-dependent epimerase/dehydratase family protein [Accumulibacter sp.]
MTTLVTGSTGFIGRALARAGDRRMARRPTDGEIRGDLLDPASLEAACEGVEAVFHCAGYAHAVFSADPALFWKVNYEGTRNLLEAAGKSGVRRFVFLSSVGAMAGPGEACVDEDHPGQPVSPYGKAKRAAEKAVLDAGAKYAMHVVNLRLTLVYGKGAPGNMAYMVRGIRAGWLPPLPETKNRRSIVHVSDVVSAMRFVVEEARANGRTYIVADPHPYSGREIYDALRKTLGMPPARWRIPAKLFRSCGRAGDAFSAVLATVSGRDLPRPSGLVSRFLDSACYSPERIKRELGWSAKIPLAEGIREMLSDDASPLCGGER